MQKCQTHYMGRVCGWHLAASGGGVLLQLIPQEPHAEPVYREGSRKGGGGRYCFYLSCFSLPTGKGLGGARLGQLFCAVLFCSLVRGEQEKRAMVPSPSPALVEKQANPCDCECGGHSWMLASRGGSSVSHLSLWLASGGRRGCSPWVGMMDVRADGAYWVPLLIGRVLGVFALTLGQVFRERRGLGVQLLGFVLQFSWHRQEFSSVTVVSNSYPTVDLKFVCFLHEGCQVY